jgi:hypothetical protein
MDQPHIEPGQLYWIELEGIRIKVRIVGPCTSIPDWWNCTSGRSGVELIIPARAVKGRAEDDGAVSG